jgi:chromosome segregation ATPase
MNLDQALRALDEMPNTHLGRAVKVVVAEMERRDPARADAAEKHAEVWQQHMSAVNAELTDLKARVQALGVALGEAWERETQLQVQLRAQLAAREELARELRVATVDSENYARLLRLERAVRSLLAIRRVFVRWSTIRNQLHPHLRPSP